MNKPIFVLLFFAFSLAFIFSCSQAEALPKRSDCIVKVIFETPEHEKLTVKESNSIFEFVYSGVHEAGQDPIVGGMQKKFIDENTVYVFIQYESQCEARFSLADDALLQSAFSESFSFISYAISREIVEPGLDTIDLTGDAWSQ